MDQDHSNLLPGFFKIFLILGNFKSFQVFFIRIVEDLDHFRYTSYSKFEAKLKNLPFALERLTMVALQTHRFFGLIVVGSQCLSWT